MSLKRGLDSRQICMIAIGGSIGTGLFLASGQTIHTAGTWGAIIGFIIVGLMVYCLMTGLGEMSAYKPVTGSFWEYASHYVSPGFGFAMTLNYWFNWSITIATESSAGSIIVKYWLPGMSSFWVALIIMSIISSLNLFSVRGFGESEYWLSFIKVAMVIGFIVLGIAMALGFVGNHSNHLFSQSKQLNLFHIHSWLSIFNVMLVAGFAFQGSEIIGVTAGETKNPRQDIPRATKLIFWRILLFYVLTILVIGAFVSANNPHLVGGNTQNVAYSPFTMVMRMAHIHFAAGLINFVVLVAVLSAANSATYTSSRMLYQLGSNADGVFSIFGKTNHRGVPVWGILATVAVGGFAFLSSYLGSGTLYTLLVSASALSGFVAWIGIAISHLCFRRAFVRAGNDPETLPYRSRAYPYGTIFALLTCLTILLGQNYTAFMQDHIEWSQVLMTYSSLILFFTFWISYSLTQFLKNNEFNRITPRFFQKLSNTFGG